MPLSFVSKKDVKGKTLVEISMEGMGSIMKQVVNEKGAYAVQQGQRKDFEGAELAEEKQGATTFEEIGMLKRTDLVLDGIEPVNGSDAYIVKNGKTSMYYDVNSGLKVLESKEIEAGDKKMTITSALADYRTVKGVKVPFKMIVNQGFDLDIQMSDVKINEGVSDADFK